MKREFISLITLLGCFAVISLNAQTATDLFKKYDSVGPLVNQYHVVSTGQGYGLVDESGKEIIPCMYLRMRHAGKKGVWVLSKSQKKKDPNLWGMVDFKNQWIVEPKYWFAGHYSEGLAVVKMSNNEAGYVDETGKEVIAPIYDDAYPCLNSKAHVKHKDKWAYLTRDGERVTEFEYTAITPMRNGRGIVWQGAVCGLIDSRGKTIFPIEYQSIQLSSQTTRYLVGKDDKYGILDQNGKPIIENQYDEIKSVYQRSILALRKGNLFAFADSQGKIFTEFKYTDFKNADESRLIVQEGRKWGILHNQGDALIPATYDSLDTYGNYFTAYFKKNVGGLLSRQGKQLTEPKYDSLYLVTERLLAYRIGKKWGLIDTNNQEQTSAVYDSLDGYYTYDRVVVYQNGKAGMVNLSGKTVLQIQFNKLKELNEKGYLFAETEGKRMYYDSTGIMLTGLLEQEAKKINPQAKFGFGQREPRPLNLDEMMAHITYPEKLRDANVKGKVLVKLLVEKDGTTLKYLIKESKHPLFTNEVTPILPFITFLPAINNGKQVRFWVSIPFKFNLK